MPPVVAIEKCDVLPFRLPDPRVPGRAWAAMGDLNQAEPRVIMCVRLNYIESVIYRGVVYYEVLKVTKCLTQYRVNSLTDVLGDVVGGCHDSDKR